jgi:predicted membrane protein
MSERERNSHRVVFGALVILVGTLALLDNMRVFNAREVIHFWPMVFVVFGVMKLFQARDPGAFIFGGALIAAGVALTLQNLGLLVIRWRDWWPVLLIGGGVLIIVSGAFGRKPGRGIAPVEFQSTSESAIDAGALLSGIKMSNATADFRGGKVSAILGGVEIDLRNASINGTATLSVFAMMGGIEIKVPNDWAVVSNCVPILGGVDDKSVPPVSAAKKLVLTGYVVMGAIEVRN